MLDRFSESCYHMKALYVQMIDLYLILLQWCYKRRPIPLVFVALVLENELQYYGLAVRINSANDACIPCENVVKFAQVTPELTELICEVRYDTAKNWCISSNISGHTGPVFAVFTI